MVKVGHAASLYYLSAPNHPLAMSRSIQTLLYAGSLLALVSCRSTESPQPKDQGPMSVFPMTVDTASVLRVSQLVDSFRLLELHPPPGEAIGRIAKIVETKDHRLYILDGIRNRIEVFTNSGQFLFAIDKAGIGSGHSRVISDIQIDLQSQTIGIIDPLQSKFLHLDLNGDLIGEYSTMGTRGVAKFAFLDSEDLAFSRGLPPDLDNFQYSIVITSPEFKIKKQLLHYDQSSSSVLSATYPFQNFAGHTYYLPIYSDEIDEVDSAGVRPVYKLDFGTKWITPDYAYDPSHTDENHWVRSELPHSGFVYFVNYAITKSELLVYYSYLGDNYLNVVDRKTGRQWHTRLSDDFRLLGFTAENSNTLSDGSYIAWISDESSIKSLQDKKSIDSLAPILADSSQHNPVLLFTTFKKAP
jgi:hypothetical protein